MHSCALARQYVCVHFAKQPMNAHTTQNFANVFTPTRGPAGYVPPVTALGRYFQLQDVSSTPTSYPRYPPILNEAARLKYYRDHQYRSVINFTTWMSWLKYRQNATADCSVFTDVLEKQRKYFRMQLAELNH
uniref:Contig, possible fusion of chromosomes 20 and 34 n=1 Tax=Ascaris lumbricoides TaxID=6252 RepID=A0A0M3HFR8_ASCLU